MRQVSKQMKYDKETSSPYVFCLGGDLFVQNCLSDSFLDFSNAPACLLTWKFYESFLCDLG